ncbi:hypothetical protein CTRI78_v001222 [Colletotrichum trifolii]|uniref:Uncharacterized protein n=1 Tax=Colletotrichum trifolii TaxID=5466 RepID=A0A4R8RZK2_COLTR|nr:hypothetical protein CTRI78_v001222 [Colletotrichum trifolii]
MKTCRGPDKLREGQQCCFRLMRNKVKRIQRRSGLPGNTRPFVQADSMDLQEISGTCA